MERELTPEEEKAAEIEGVRKRLSAIVNNPRSTQSESVRAGDAIHRLEINAQLHGVKLRRRPTYGTAPDFDKDGDTNDRTRKP